MIVFVFMPIEIDEIQDRSRGFRSHVGEQANALAADFLRRRESFDNQDRAVSQCRENGGVGDSHDGRAIEDDSVILLRESLEEGFEAVAMKQLGWVGRNRPGW